MLVEISNLDLLTEDFKSSVRRIRIANADQMYLLVYLPNSIGYCNA
jgi:hypothetical protein